MGAGGNQNEKLCRPSGSRTRQKREEWWENGCKQAKHPNARFLVWFPSNSNVFSTAAYDWLNVPIVQGRARSPQARESSGFRLMTNAKPVPRILMSDGPWNKRSGKSLEER